MAELQMELMSGVADFKSVLHDLDACLARLVSAEDDLQREVGRLERLEAWLNPRRFVTRLRAMHAATGAWASVRRMAGGGGAEGLRRSMSPR